MIKVTYKSLSKKMDKPEETTIRIFDGKMFVSYNVPNKAKTTVEQMKKDGRTGVLFSRGQMIQIFQGKTAKQILDIVYTDIKNGVYVAKEKTGDVIEIKDLVVEEQ